LTVRRHTLVSSITQSKYDCRHALLFYYIASAGGATLKLTLAQSLDDWRQVTDTLGLHCGTAVP